MKKEEETGKTLGDGNHLQGGSGLFFDGESLELLFLTARSDRKRLEVLRSKIQSFFLLSRRIGLHLGCFFVILHFIFSRKFILQLFYRP